jgi:hypothetical protein
MYRACYTVTQKCTIMLVRVSMGLSFYDEPSLEETSKALGEFQFAASNPNPNVATGSITGSIGRNGTLHIELDASMEENA